MSKMWVYVEIYIKTNGIIMIVCTYIHKYLAILYNKVEQTTYYK